MFDGSCVALAMATCKSLHECFFAFCNWQLGCGLWAAVFVFDDLFQVSTWFLPFPLSRLVGWLAAFDEGSSFLHGGSLYIHHSTYTFTSLRGLSLMCRLCTVHC